MSITLTYLHHDAHVMKWLLHTGKTSSTGRCSAPKPEIQYLKLVK